MNLRGASERARGERQMHSLFIVKDKRRTKTKGNEREKKCKTARLCLDMCACRHICVRTDRKCSFSDFFFAALGSHLDRTHSDSCCHPQPVLTSIRALLLIKQERKSVREKVCVFVCGYI